MEARQPGAPPIAVEKAPEEEAKGGGADEFFPWEDIGGKPPSDVRQRQMTCAVKDLKKDEQKLLGVGGGKRVARATVKQILEKDKEDESLSKYKKTLLGNLGELDE